MIITRTPVRIEFLGGGTDMSYFCNKYPGKSLNAAINRYVYLSVNNHLDQQIKVRYFKNEYVNLVSEIKHTRVKAILEHFKIRDPNLEITSTADIPSKGSGLGSSSSFTVGLIAALAQYKALKLSVRQLAELACHIEIDVLGEPIGKQDQYMAAFGGILLKTYKKGGKVAVKNLSLSNTQIGELEKHLMLVYTGKNRSASNILQEQKKNLDKKIPFLIKMAKLAQVGAEVLEKGDLKTFAQILEEEWVVKKNIGPITNNRLEEMYKQAKSLGAWGGRVSGAGGGGFFVLIVPPNKQKKFENVFKAENIIHPKIVDHGAQIISDERSWK